MKYSAKILGIGVTVDNLTFVHTVEDTLKDTFPVKTRNDEVYPCRCIDSEGNERIITTMVASKAIGHRDVFGFFKKHVTTTMYRPIRVKNMDFFSLDALQTYDQLKSLALSGKSIYHF
jgi:aminoglycoside 3-N-acetyltransferase